MSDEKVINFNKARIERELGQVGTLLQCARCDGTDFQVICLHSAGHPFIAAVGCAGCKTGADDQIAYAVNNGFLVSANG